MDAALLATIPPPPFRNLELGPVVLHGYGLCIGLGIVLAMWIAEGILERAHVDTSRFTNLALLAVAGGFVGGRLYHVASEPVKFFHHPGDIVAVWHGGLGIYGAVLGGALVGLGLAPRFGIPRGALADAGAPALLAAQAIGRLGNYLNQELFGRPFDGAWALEVEQQRRPAAFRDQATFHPTFAYEAVANALLAAALLVLLRRWRHRAPGVVFALYVAAYSVVRLCVETLRIDPAHEWHGVRQNVWVAGSLVVLGLAAAAGLQHRYVRRAAA